MRSLLEFVRKGNDLKVTVIVTLKADVLDPEGEAIRKVSRSLGYEAVEGVRQGKFFEINIEGRTEQEAKSLAEDLAEKFLANPVIEDYRVERVEL